MIVSQATGGAPNFHLRRNLRLFYVLGVAREFTPLLAVWVVYLTDFRHLTLTQVGIMEGLFWGVKLAMEVPSGAFADHFGRKPTFLAGVAMEAVGTALFAFSGDFVLLAISYVIWSGGLAFRSGNAEAYLYDTLATGSEEEHYSDRIALYTALGTGAVLAGSALGGVLADVASLQWAIIAALVPFALATPVLLAMEEPPRHRTPASKLTLAGTLVTGVHEVWRNPALRYITIFQVALAGAFPAFILLSQPFLDKHGVPLALFGVLTMPILLAQTAGGLLSGRAKRAFGLPAILGGALGAVVLGIAVMAVVDHVGAFAALGLSMAGVAIATPAIGAYVNDRTGSHIRATVLSVGPMGSSVTMGLMSVAAGTIGAQSLQIAFGVLALGIAVVAGGAFLAWLAVHSEIERRPVEDALEV